MGVAGGGGVAPRRDDNLEGDLASAADGRSERDGEGGGGEGELAAEIAELAAEIAELAAEIAELAAEIAELGAGLLEVLAERALAWG